MADPGTSLSDPLFYRQRNICCKCQGLVNSREWEGFVNGRRVRGSFWDVATLN